MKQISEEKKIVIAFLILLMLAIVMDLSKGNIKDGVIDRAELGGDEKEYQLQLDIGEVLQDYAYTLNVPPMIPTKEEAEQYFESVVTQIEQDFEGIEDEIPIQTSYMEDVVKAKWSFLPFGIIDSTGKINYENLEEDTMIQAEVKLICGEYEHMHAFSFLLKKPQLTEVQAILQKIDKSLAEQLQQEGNRTVTLPTEIEGNTLVWKETKEYVTPQMLLLELLAIILFGFVKIRMKKEEDKKRLQEMELEYPDIVSQLSLLMGAGMTTRQAWNRMAMQYNFKRKNAMITKKPVYEAILRMNGRLVEGVSERAAYEQFRTEIPATCYHKLMRILLGSLEMGSQGICVRLEEESRAAFEQRIIQAKKSGEEASTKMLGPLMLQMLIVMGIVMFPALIGFQI